MSSKRESVNYNFNFPMKKTNMDVFEFEARIRDKRQEITLLTKLK